ncbi:hypothetical protein BJX63DRAFT_62769 [Aspergillus granulosus]|uniref:Uncharacterized protein n=1 Tax=Aspergillus granulosus TaxID=176169 RepID=A0ABR4GWU9_9EURO
MVYRPTSLKRPIILGMLLPLHHQPLLYLNHTSSISKTTKSENRKQECTPATTSSPQPKPSAKPFNPLNVHYNPFAAGPQTWITISRAPSGPYIYKPRWNKELLQHPQ